MLPTRCPRALRSAALLLLLGTSTAPAMADAPIVYTRPAVAITSSNAVLGGMVVPNGAPAVAWFEWGARGTFDQATPPQAVGDGSGVVSLTTQIAGLTNHGDYQFRLVASNATAQIHGAMRMFTTGRRIVAWGDNSFGQLNVPANLNNAVAVGGGEGFTLALKNDGTIISWGTAAGGSAPALSNVVAIAAGRYHALALLSDGTVTAWGTWENGPAVAPAGLSNVVEISAGEYGDLALKVDGTVTSFGFDTVGQLDVSDLTNIVDIMTCETFSVLLQAGGTPVGRGAVPEPGPWQTITVPSGLSNVVDLQGTAIHCLTLRDDSTVVAFGYGGDGQTNVPVGLSNVVATAAGYTESLVLFGDSTVAAWGSGVATNVPAGLSNVTTVASGLNHGLALGNLPPLTTSRTNIGYPNTDVLIPLQRSDPDGDSLTVRVVAPPATGTLFQYGPGVRGPAITAPETLVTDAGARVIYSPPTNTVGLLAGLFSFVANDGEVDSQPGVISVNLRLPAAPRFSSEQPGVFTNGGFQLQFTGSGPATYRIWASTNLVDWVPIGTAIYLGQLSLPYRYLDADATNWPIRFYRAGAP